MSKYDTLLESATAEFPSLRVVEKEGWFWKLLNTLLVIFSFGKNKTFLTKFITTIGPVIAVPKDWPASDETKYMVLAHELVHIKQQARLGFGNPWVGLVPFAIAYLFLPIPTLFAYCRYRFELEAYVVSIHKALELYGKDTAMAYLDAYVNSLSGYQYIWAWPFKEKIKEVFLNKVPELRF